MRTNWSQSRYKCPSFSVFLCLSSEDRPAADHQTGADSDQDEDRLFAGTPGEDREAAESWLWWESERRGKGQRNAEGGKLRGHTSWWHCGEIRAVELSVITADRCQRHAESVYMRGLYRCPATTGRSHREAHREGHSDSTPFDVARVSQFFNSTFFFFCFF